MIYRSQTKEERTLTALALSVHMWSNLVAGVDLLPRSPLILRKLLILQLAKTAKKARGAILSDIFLTLSNF